MTQAIKVGSLIFMSNEERLRTKIKVIKHELETKLKFEYDDLQMSYVCVGNMDACDIKGRTYILGCLEKELVSLIPF